MLEEREEKHKKPTKKSQKSQKPNSAACHIGRSREKGSMEQKTNGGRGSARVIIANGRGEGLKVSRRGRSRGRGDFRHTEGKKQVARK